MEQSGRRRILIVAPETPDSLAWGFAIRVHNLAEQLATRHDVTLLAYAHTPAPPGDSPQCGYRVLAVPKPAARGDAKRRAQLRTLVRAGSHHRSSGRAGRGAGRGHGPPAAGG